jgi:ribonucleoside-diphosphate reductase alpha chain
MEVGAWVYRNFDEVSGIAFFPATNHAYKQAPYQACTKDEYDKLLAIMPKDVDWSRLKEYESDDTSVSHKEFACTGNGACEIVDLSSHKSK